MITYDEETDTDYAFVAGRNLRNLTLRGSWNGKSNIGIFKDALGDNPQLVAATRQIPYATASDLAVSSDGGFLFAAYPGIESTLAYDVGEIIETINSPDAQVRKRLEKEAIDEVNPDVSLAADLEIVSSNPWTREVEWRVPEGSQNGPISTGSLAWGVEMASNQVRIDPAPVDGRDLTPTLKWNIYKSKNQEQGDDCVSCDPPNEDKDNIESIKLYLSVFGKDEGLLPDTWPKNVPGDWPSKTDYNPNRIITAEWRDNKWTWVGNNQEIPQETPDVPNPEYEWQFTLPDDRMLTAGQTYHWAVEVKLKNGKKLPRKTKSFKTSYPEADGSNQYSSVTVLTRGFEPDPELDGEINRQLMSTAKFIAGKEGAIKIYNWDTHEWELFGNRQPQYGKPLVLLPSWVMSSTHNSERNGPGFAEAAADTLFASLVSENQGQITDKLFTSPMHFVGFGQGAVVNTEIIQRLGTFFPKEEHPNLFPDLHMTTIDPHDYDEDSPQLVPDFPDFRDPTVKVWENVTFADNYYQDSSDSSKLKGQQLDDADLNKLLPPSFGFNPEDEENDPHINSFVWYMGTANVNKSVIRETQKRDIYRRLGDLYKKDVTDEEEDKNPNIWYTPDHINTNFEHGAKKAPWEGIGTGWFYSKLGGGLEVRPQEEDDRRTPLYEDNSPDKRMRGDSAVPTLFNGNFDGIYKPKTFDVIPGWSFKKEDSDNRNDARQHHLKAWHEIPSLRTHLRRVDGEYDRQRPNYALRMGSGGTNTIIHNPFVIPDTGTLHFNLHAPEKPKGDLKILMKRPEDDRFERLTEISLNEAVGTPGEYGRDLKRVDYGFSGFETFQVNIPARYRRGAGLALLKFEFNPVDSATIYIDDIAFKSPHLKFGNPSEAKFNPDAPNFNNLLLEKPQYALSYNSGELRPNWASWQVNKSWTVGNAPRRDVFIADPQLPAGITKVDSSYYEDDDGYSLGYDRGHMAPARDRNRSKKDKTATFLGTNIVPQSVDNNRFFPSEPTDNIIHASAWNNIENYVPKLVDNGNELYVAAGSAGTNWEPQKQSNVFDELRDLYTDSETFQERGIHIPEWTWKAILVLDTPGLDVQDVIDNPSRAKTYAFITPNVAEPFEDWNKKTIPHPLNPLLSKPRGNITTKREWRSPETWQVTVNELETILEDRYNTPLDFISQIPKSIGSHLKDNDEAINI